MIGLARKHPSAVELSRALTDGLTPNLERHIAECSECAATWSSFARVDALAQELPTSSSSNDRDEELLAGILATTTAKQEPRARRARWFVPAGLAIAAAASAATFVATSAAPAPEPTRLLPERGPTYRGAVSAEPGARFVRVSSAPDEVVRLHQGKISVDVTPLLRGERFRVVVADAEIEGQSASFDVVAQSDTLATVQVVQGRVDIRPTQRLQAVVIAGQRWEAAISPDRATLLERNAAATEQPTTAVVAAPRTSITPAQPADLPMAKLFDQGWKHLHAHDYGAAINAFDDALAKYPRDPLAEDVAFWRGVALARAKRSADAIRALSAFVDNHPRSPRFGEASAMLGWLLAETGELDEAKRRFSGARQDPVDSVRASAEKGLSAVETMQNGSGR